MKSSQAGRTSPLEGPGSCKAQTDGKMWEAVPGSTRSLQCIPYLQTTGLPGGSRPHLPVILSTPSHHPEGDATSSSLHHRCIYSANSSFLLLPQASRCAFLFFSYKCSTSPQPGSLTTRPSFNHSQRHCNHWLQVQLVLETDIRVQVSSEDSLSCLHPLLFTTPVWPNPTQPSSSRSSHLRQCSGSASSECRSKPLTYVRECVSISSRF